ncbi:hypothetical protein BDB01DRAFT_774119 [Pilobolus umbonatus]|nr:hypothetical protein BDB01DRAFT_774119 [Pilobolus umbonatus]
MLPNSRIIPTNTLSTQHNKSIHNYRRRSNSASPVYETKKGFISRLLTTPKDNMSITSSNKSIGDNETITSSRSRKDTEDPMTVSLMQLVTLNSNSSDNKKSKKGFTKLFKKRGKIPVVEDEVMMIDDQPTVRPVNQNRTHTKIPLAPPPNYPRPMHTLPSPQPESFLSSLPDQYIAKRNTQSSNDIFPQLDESSNSIRKSSGSFSIYSTFGGPESIYSLDDVDSPISDLSPSIPRESMDSFNTVSSAMENHSSEETIHLSTDPSINTSQNSLDSSPVSRSDSSEDTDDTDDDEFVDAAGFSQEDIEKEHHSLTNRLSGGHFGSAGGLLLSISNDIPPLPTSHSKETHLTITDEDDEDNESTQDLAESMLNWKRHSGSSKRWSAIRESAEYPIPIREPKRTSEITVIDMRAPESNEEISVPDILALRKETEDVLNGKLLDTTCTALSAEFSKTLDDVWNNSQDIIVDVKDPRIKIDTIQIKIDEDPDEREKIRETAHMLWNEDESFVTKEKIAEWLGKGKPFQSSVLYYYMDYFDFTDMRLDDAFRKLCSKLYFKAEAQQIDRILESFANRYWTCNTQSLFGNADIVYAIVYSLLLLNTDLHVVQGNHPRMTRSEFVRNTMSTVCDQKEHEELMGHHHEYHLNRNWESELEAHLREIYTSVKHHQILQPLNGKPTTLQKRSSLLGGRKTIGIKRSVHSMIRKSGRESMIVDEQAPSRNSISSGHSRPLTPSLKSPRRDSYSSTGSSAASLSSRGGNKSPTSSHHHYQPMMQYLNTHASSLFSSRAPYYKEGVVMRKHLLESSSQKAKHRDWKECFVEVGHEGELRMYSLQGTSTNERSLFRHSSAQFMLPEGMKSSSSTHLSNVNSSSFGGVLSSGSSKWGAHSQLTGKIQLNHTLSNPLPPPGYNRQRPHVFALQQSNGGVYLFQSGSAEQTQEWVDACNYWAARESKEPLPEGVSNMEYGWGRCLHDVIMDLDAERTGYHSLNNCYLTDPDTVMINDWLPPCATMISSLLDEKEQCEMIQKHLHHLNTEINEHKDLKSKILIKFPSKCNNHAKVIRNWEARSKYLLHEIIKYQNYNDALEKSIQKKNEIDYSYTTEEVSSPQSTLSPTSSSRLMFKETSVDLFKEINDELHLSL